MKKLSNIFSIIAVTACLAVAPVLRGEEPVTWQLAPQAQVDSTGIFLVQLASPSSTTVVPPQIRLAPAPHLGQTVSLSREQIAELAHKQSPSLVLTNWSGAEQVHISRRTRQFGEFDLTSMMTATMQQEYVKDRGELEIRLTRPWVPVDVPDEALSVKVFDLPNGGINPDCAVHCELWNGQERVGRWEVVFHASIWKDVPIAHSGLIRGELLKDADISLERRDVLVLRDAFMNFAHADNNLQLAENLTAGSPVLNRSVRMRPIIQRGQVVEGIFVEGALTISLKVETLEDGLLGQTIRIRNPKTKRELHGKVQNDQTVFIAL
ncbi:MAG TPA: flagellar basal body P-ring formation chaperone FlgA [Verrucomicrobiae bacterium]|jgi:flagella basal body P-ring formation protein FlgA